MDKKTLEAIPSYYSVCTLADCKMASTCLHQQAYAVLARENDYLRLLSPRLCSKDEKCKHYRNNKPETYARGFTNMQKCMLTGQYKRFINMMMRHYARSTYFKMRSGKTPLSPKDQAYILNILRQIGVTQDLKFDSYEDIIIPDD